MACHSPKRTLFLRGIFFFGLLFLNPPELFAAPVGPGGPRALSDVEMPVCHILKPQDGEEVGGIVEIEADAKDNTAVFRVVFFTQAVDCQKIQDNNVEGKLLGTVTQAPFKISWNTSDLEYGCYQIRATAVDASGNQNSKKIVVTVGRSKPKESPKTKPEPEPEPPLATVPAQNAECKITTPSENQTVEGFVTIEARAEHPKKVAHVEFYVQEAGAENPDGRGKFLGRSISSPYRTLWDTGDKKGEYQIVAVAIGPSDEELLEDSVSVSVSPIA